MRLKQYKGKPKEFDYEDTFKFMKTLRNWPRMFVLKVILFITVLPE